VIEYYLSDVSFLDMQNCNTRYVTLFDIIEVLASRTQFQNVLLPRKGISKSIYSIIKSLKTQTKLVISENKNDSSDSQLDFVKQINRLWEVLKAVKKQPPPSDTTTGTTISSSSSSSSTSTSTSTTTSTQIQNKQTLIRCIWEVISYPCRKCYKKKQNIHHELKDERDSLSIKIEKKDFVNTTTKKRQRQQRERQRDHTHHTRSKRKR